MASSRRFFFAFLLSISSQIFLGFSQDDHHDLGSLGLEGTDSIVGIPGLMPECVQKILPCQKYIKSPGNPPPACCTPLKETLAGDLDCLCSFFNNAELLKAMNATRTEALQLPKACGADLDESACDRAKASSPANSPIGSLDALSAKISNGSSATNPSSASRNNNPTYGIGYGLAAAASSFVALLLNFNIHFGFLLSF